MIKVKLCLKTELGAKFIHSTHYKLFKHTHRFLVDKTASKDLIILILEALMKFE